MQSSYHETQLPKEYTPSFIIDLQKNKKQAIIINVFAYIIMIIMYFLGTLYIPFNEFTKGSNGEIAIKFGVTITSFILYIVLHECIHGIAMKTCGTKKVKYGFTGVYAFAGSDDYYYKWPYIYIALAPVVFFLIILGIMMYFAPFEWFWPIYLIQIANIAGASGDIYVFIKMLKYPKDVLIKDSGTKMTVFTRNIHS